MFALVKIIADNSIILQGLLAQGTDPSVRVGFKLQRLPRTEVVYVCNTFTCNHNLWCTDVGNM
jgi:hypothetical protein